MLTHTIKYKSGKFELVDKEKVRLKEFVSKLEYQDVTYVINGFSDSSADHEYNLALSKARAQGVSDLLKSIEIPSDKITDRSFGERAFSGNDEASQITRSVVLQVF